MTEQQIIMKLAALCSSAEHCSDEMIEKMRKWEVDEQTQARVMEYLIREKYVDDERFARYFVRDKIRFNKWGRRKVEMALAQKRVDKSTVMAVLDEVSDEDYIAVLRPLIRQKAKSTKANSEYEKNLKLIRFALGRGFSYDIIKAVLGGEIPDETVDF